MEPTTGPARPPALTRLCIASFLDQGLFIPLYLLGIPATMVMREMDPTVLNDTVRAFYSGFVPAEQLDDVFNYVTLLREHGLALMIVFALRTIGRLIGTLRMWKLKGDGLHIYITSQLLGLLVPMIIAGAKLFAPISLVIVLAWSYLYWAQRKALTA